MPSPTKKYHIFLNKIFRIRTDISKFQSEDNEFLLITTPSVSERLSDSLKDCFTDIKFCDFSESGLIDTVKAFMKELNIDSSQISIVTNDEFAMIPAAKLREALNIKGANVASVEPFINKVIMKEVVEKSGIRIPKYISFDPHEYALNKEEYIEEILMDLGTEHIFAKPIDSVASNGVAEITSREELSAWCESHQDATNYELDEFLEGDLYHVDSLVKDSEVLDSLPFIYANPCAEFMDGKVFGSRLLTKDDAEYDELIEFNHAVLKAMPAVPDGGTHHELFRKHDGELVFLEIAARPSGGPIPEIHELHAGIHGEEAHYRVQMDLPLPEFIPADQRTMSAAWCGYPKMEGVVSSLNTHTGIKSQHKLTHLVKPGDELGKAESLIDLTSMIFISSEDKEQLKQDFELAAQLKPVTIYPKSKATNHVDTESKIMTADKRCKLTLS